LPAGKELELLNGARFTRFIDFTHISGGNRKHAPTHIDYATGLYIKLNALIIYDPIWVSINGIKLNIKGF